MFAQANPECGTPATDSLKSQAVAYITDGAFYLIPYRGAGNSKAQGLSEEAHLVFARDNTKWAFFSCLFFPVCCSNSLRTPITSREHRAKEDLHCL